MKFLPLVWRNLTRKWVRTVFTLLSICVAFILYGVLIAVQTGFGSGIELAGLDRLVMIHKVSLIQPLPYSYLGRIQSDEGVENVAHANWFGGIYQEPRNFFAQIAVVPETWLEVYPEIELPAEQEEAWLRNRIGAIVGKRTAERFGFEVGDRIPIQGTIYRPVDGESTWEFVIEGIYDSSTKGFDTSQFFFHYDYLLENSGMEGFVGWYVLDLEDGADAVAVAERLDARFANSPAETKTSTEKAFIQGFANQAGNIAAIVRGILVVVFFTLLLVSGNTMAQSVRERTRELAVLKTLGFRDGQVMRMIIAESLVLAVVGGGLGLGLVTWVTQAFDLGGSLLPTLYIPWRFVVAGSALVVLVGVASGLVPSIQALRLQIVDALGRRN